MAFGRVSFYQKQRFDNVMSNFALSGGYWYYKATAGYRILLPLLMKN
jgi:hypothetical protein